MHRESHHIVQGGVREGSNRGQGSRWSRRAALSFERTKHSKDQLRYFIHLGYVELKKKSLKPLFLFEGFESKMRSKVKNDDISLL